MNEYTPQEAPNAAEAERLLRVARDESVVMIGIDFGVADHAHLIVGRPRSQHRSPSDPSTAAELRALAATHAALALAESNWRLSQREATVVNVGPLYESSAPDERFFANDQVKSTTVGSAGSEKPRRGWRGGRRG